MREYVNNYIKQMVIQIAEQKKKTKHRLKILDNDLQNKAESQLQIDKIYKVKDAMQKDI